MTDGTHLICAVPAPIGILCPCIIMLPYHTGTNNSTLENDNVKDAPIKSTEMELVNKANLLNKLDQVLLISDKI